MEVIAIKKERQPLLVLSRLLPSNVGGQFGGVNLDKRIKHDTI